MSDVNKTILTGRLVKNAETKTTADGLFIANFCIASNASKRQKDGSWTQVPHFFYHTLYGNRAQALAPYLVQGQLVEIEGRLIQRRWEKDGKKLSRMENAVDDIKLVGYPPQLQVKNETGNHEQNPKVSNQEIPSLDSNAFSNRIDELPFESFDEEFLEPEFQGDIF